MIFTELYRIPTSECTKRNPSDNVEILNLVVSVVKVYAYTPTLYRLWRTIFWFTRIVITTCLPTVHLVQGYTNYFRSVIYHKTNTHYVGFAFFHTML